MIHVLTKVVEVLFGRITVRISKPLAGAGVRAPVPAVSKIFLFCSVRQLFTTAFSRKRYSPASSWGDTLCLGFRRSAFG
jgi:hypothetical protein